MAQASALPADGPAAALAVAWRKATCARRAEADGRREEAGDGAEEDQEDRQDKPAALNRAVLVAVQ